MSFIVVLFFLLSPIICQSIDALFIVTGLDSFLVIQFDVEVVIMQLFLDLFIGVRGFCFGTFNAKNSCFVFVIMSALC